MNWHYLWSETGNPSVLISLILGTVGFTLRLIYLQVRTKYPDRRTRVSSSMRYGVIAGVSAAVVTVLLTLRHFLAMVVLAHAGDSFAQFDLAVACYDGTYFLDRDVDQSAFWFRRSAESGNADAQCNIGLAYQAGKGVPRDLEMAAYWLDKAASHGQMKAAATLGMMYWNGLGVHKDQDRAIQLLTEAANSRDLDGISGLGSIYWSQTSDPEKAKRGVSLFVEGAKQGDCFCLYFLGLSFKQGWGSKQDDQAAAQCFKIALPELERKATQNDARAATILGVAYLQGTGLPMDVVRGQMWLVKAAANGNPFAQTLLQQIDSRSK